MKLTDAQSIFDTFNACKDNKERWNAARQVSTQATKHEKEIKTLNKQIKALEEKTAPKEKGEGFEDPAELLENKQALRMRVMKDLLEGSSKQNAQASDKLAKLAGLDADKQDISIELVQYSETPLECPSCGENLHKPA